MTLCISSWLVLYHSSERVSLQYHSTPPLCSAHLLALAGMCVCMGACTPDLSHSD